MELINHFPETVLALDREAFFLINGGWSHPLLDVIMPVLRAKYIWVPLYVFVLAYLWQQKGIKGIYGLLWILLAFALADGLSSHVIKPLVERLRPCNDPFISPHVNLLVSCGSGFSFTSSHATNHFALAWTIPAVLFPGRRPLLYSFLVWAALISLAQVYVGVHYPLDILCGAMLGTLIGLCLRYIRARIVNPAWL